MPKAKRSTIRTERINPPYPITKEFAVAELRRFAELYPGSAPEVPAFGLLRHVDSWEELAAIQAAVAQVLREQDGE